MRLMTTIAFDYVAFVADSKKRIASARLTAAHAVNSESVSLYWVTALQPPRQNSHKL